MISNQNVFFFFFWTLKQCFASHFSLASCILTVPEIIVQTQGSDYWQLIHWLPPVQVGQCAYYAHNLDGTCHVCPLLSLILQNSLLVL